jgi:uncharacterized protein YacL
MYSSTTLFTIVGILLSLGFIFLMVWYVNTKTGDHFKTKEWLTKFVSLLLTSLVGLFIVDKIIGFKFQLLTQEMSESLFELIKNIVLIVFGYQFGGKINDRGNGNRDY